MCGIKNFVSVRLYSAPQSHWTIVSILGICADGGVDQTEIDRHIQRSLLPPGQRRPGSLPGGRRSARQLCVIPDRRHQCAHRRMGRMRGHTLPLKYPGPGYPIPIPMAGSRAVWAIHLSRQSRPRRQCLILGQTGRAARRIFRRWRCRRRRRTTRPQPRYSRGS